MTLLESVSTGLKGFDEIIHNLRFGDNVVFQVDNLDDYLHFVNPFVKKALSENKRLVYIRFAKHPLLIEERNNVKTYRLDASSGFESFSKQVHDIAAKEGKGVFYVFDCLSDLLSAWATDLMIGNFFMVTCPYLFRLDTVAYFAILRNNHSFKTIARVRETTQLLLDIYNIENKFYVHPLKVWNRFSPTMFLPHEEKEDKFLPLTNSVDATRIFSYLSHAGVESAQRNLDFWDHLFFKAGVLSKETRKDEEKKEMFKKLCRIMLGHEQTMLSLIEKNLTLPDLLSIKSRMIGSGFLGGKAVGMLLSRKMLAGWENILEPHDSFYVGSDVFYTYIVENSWWELWLEQKTEEGYFSKAAELREKMLQGKFPEQIKEQFEQMLEYFGQSPIIVRSSSLLEDSFGNAFAGKYESIFCVNQGTPEKRYKQFEEIVRQIYAGTLNEDALHYRKQRGLASLNEEMALLVQRVSGTQHKKYFLPFLAGVGFSYNTFVWHKRMNPAAGMLRLVFGLGTRAVNRVEGDYPRIIALDEPLLKPYSGMDKIKKFSQHEVDVLNIKENQLQTIPLNKLAEEEKISGLDLIGERDREGEIKLKEIGISEQSWVLTFDQFINKTEFIKHLQSMLKTLEEKYNYPVDIEFTLNYADDGLMRINLLQCRPLQAKGLGAEIKIPHKISKDLLVFESIGNFMGGSVSLPIQRIIYIDPKGYKDLTLSEKHEVARTIGKINKKIERRDHLPTLLIGPGRWGTRDPFLGIPVAFAEINNICALIELADPESGFMPELSFGSHFFLDLVETNIFYAALFPQERGVFLNKPYLKELPNLLDNILPEAAGFTKIIKACDFFPKKLQLLSDITSQRVVCVK